MKCVLCEGFSLAVFCKKCYQNLLHISPSSREIDGFKIYTFYHFSDVDFLLRAKYYAIGSRVYRALARRANEYFSHHFSDTISALKQDLGEIFSAGIDCRPKNGYSHVACILREFRRNFHPLFGELRAQNPVQYAGQSLAFRLANKKNYRYDAGAKNLVIFDDIITTGTSILEARDIVQNAGSNVLFAVALCDANL